MRFSATHTLRIALGVALVAAALLVAAWDTDPLLEAELSVRRFVKPEAPSSAMRIAASATPTHGAARADRRVVIPSVGIDSPISESANAFAGLKRGVWRDPHGGVPGSGEPVVLAGHRTRARFAMLHRTGVGDQVVVYWDGEEFDYRVTRRWSVDATEGIELASPGGSPGERLVLYTCLPRWQGDKRTIVEARPVTAP